MNILSSILTKFSRIFIWWYVINPWEKALRVRLGKWVSERGPGIHFNIPYIDAFYVQTDRLRTCELNTQSLSSLDGYILTLQGIIRYRIVDMKKLYDTLHHPETTIINIVMAKIAGIVSKENKVNLNAEHISNLVNQDLNLDEFGLGDGQFNVTDFTFARAIRLIGDYKRWNTADRLSTNSTENTNNIFN